MEKIQKIAATCVRCHRPRENTVDSPALSGTIFVCNRPDCPNYGLLSICQEKMDEFETKK